jgi:serine/threonine-protein kinase
MRRVSQHLLCILALAPSAALAQDYFGAIAYSPRTGAHGWAKDYPSRDAAERAALSICRKHASDCRAVLWFRNACGALATGAGGPGWAWAETQLLADNEAMKLCAKHSSACTVKRRVCTTR